MILIGDEVTKALELVGITQERVSRWLRGQCHCEVWRGRLNHLSVWAAALTKQPAERQAYYAAHLERLLVRDEKTTAALWTGSGI